MIDFYVSHPTLRSSPLQKLGIVKCEKLRHRSEQEPNMQPAYQAVIKMFAYMHATNVSTKFELAAYQMRRFFMRRFDNAALRIIAIPTRV